MKLRLALFIAICGTSADALMCTDKPSIAKNYEWRIEDGGSPAVLLGKITYSEFPFDEYREFDSVDLEGQVYELLRRHELLFHGTFKGIVLSGSDDTEEQVIPILVRNCVGHGCIGVRQEENLVHIVAETDEGYEARGHECWNSSYPAEDVSFFSKTWLCVSKSICLP